MAENCVVELCRQPALRMSVTVELGNVRLELPLCAVHGDEVRNEVGWLQLGSREVAIDD